MNTLSLLQDPKRYLFFTGKGGVGKTALSCAAALSLADQVTRADRGAVLEAARTSDELRNLGLGNQLLIVNGVFHASVAGDAVADGLERDHAEVLADLPANLSALPKAEVPLRSFDMVGLLALRALMQPEPASPRVAAVGSDVNEVGLAAMVDDLARAGRGLIMVMGKSGAGKTTVAAAIAVGLVRRGHAVHLTTTDPAAHVSLVADETLPGLTIDRIDPLAETARYVEKIMATGGRDLDGADRALMREDLASPCTEEVAVFDAFSRTVAAAPMWSWTPHRPVTPCCCWMPRGPITGKSRMTWARPTKAES